jgi:3-oxoadipate enol-lactonase
MAFAKINGIDLYYEVHGEGPPLILSHGIGSNHLHWWQQVPAFSKHFQVIVFDHRGFGFSKDTNCLGPKAFVDDLEGLLSHLNIGKAALCGQSMGGITVAGYATRHPERVKAFILSCSGGGFFPVVHPESFRQAMARVRNYQEFAKLSIEQDGFPQRHPALRFLFESMAQLNHDFDMSRAADLRSMQFDLAPIVKDGIPTLLIGAEDDNGANAALTRIHEAVAGSKLVIIPSAGHLSFFESADSYNRAVLEFLSR